MWKRSIFSTMFVSFFLFVCFFYFFFLSVDVRVQCTCACVCRCVCVCWCVYRYVVRSRTCDAPFIITNDCGFFSSIPLPALFLFVFSVMYRCWAITNCRTVYFRKAHITTTTKKRHENENERQQENEHHERIDMYTFWIGKLCKSP